VDLRQRIRRLESALGCEEVVIVVVEVNGLTGERREAYRVRHANGTCTVERSESAGADPRLHDQPSKGAVGG
jgi:hypothetical protein